MLQVIVNRRLFLQLAQPAAADGAVTLRGHAGTLAAASPGGSIHFRLPAQVVAADQVTLSGPRWQALVTRIAAAGEAEVELRLE